MRRGAFCVLGALLASAVMVVQPAAGALRLSTVVQANPADWTPKAPRSQSYVQIVDAYAQVGKTMYAGGSVRRVTNASGTTVLAVHNLFRFSATTGALGTHWLPAVDGRVWAMARNRDGSALFIAGAFAHVDGSFRKGLARIDLRTGKLDKNFRAQLNGVATDVHLVGGRLIVSGSFSAARGQPRVGLAALNPRTGAPLPYLRLHVAGAIPQSARTQVFRFAVNPAHTLMVVLGNFTSISGVLRRQAAMVSLGPQRAFLRRWNSPTLSRRCASPSYLRDVDFGPRGGYFAMVATGGAASASKLCDSVSLWRTQPTNAIARPSWVNYTGGDTLNSVALTGTAVYISGHERWADNPVLRSVPCTRPDGSVTYAGNNCPGPTAVSRRGIGAIDFSTGKALPWNPTRDRGIGSFRLYATGKGLWVGSDTKFGSYRMGHENHPCIGFLPL